MRKWMMALFCALLCLPGCAVIVGNDNGEEYEIYCLADLAYHEGADAVQGIGANAHGENTERLASALLRKMSSVNAEGCRSALPKGTEVLDVSIENGVAFVNLSEEYGRLSGIDLTLSDYCITLTLSQIPSVDRVSILVDGEILPYREKQIFSKDDVLLSYMDEEIRTLWVRLYYPKVENGELASESRNLQLSEGQTKVAVVMEALLQGPQNETMYAVIPDNVQLLSARLDGGICYVTLSKEFLENKPGSLRAQENVVYSIVKTLCSLSDVQAVQLAVDGETVHYYGGLDISVPLS